jgi:hypothetical protein
LTDEQAATLRRVEQARRRIERAQDGLHAAIEQALAADVPRSRVLETGGISRATYWRHQQQATERQQTK